MFYDKSIYDKCIVTKITEPRKVLPYFRLILKIHSKFPELIVSRKLSNDYLIIALQIFLYLDCFYHGRVVRSRISSVSVNLCNGMVSYFYFLAAISLA